MCQRYRCLPYEGGLLDQPWLLIEGMTMVARAQAEREELEQARQEMKRGTRRKRA